MRRSLVRRRGASSSASQVTSLMPRRICSISRQIHSVFRQMCSTSRQIYSMSRQIYSISGSASTAPAPSRVWGLAFSYGIRSVFTVVAHQTDSVHTRLAEAVRGLSPHSELQLLRFLKSDGIEIDGRKNKMWTLKQKFID